MEKNQRELEPLVLAVDCGTQSVRGLIFDTKGQLLAKVKREFEPYVSSEPGMAEQDPYVYWDYCRECILELHHDYEEVMDRVRTITVTAIRNTGICLGYDGKVVRPSLIWLDQREAKNTRKISPHYMAVFKLIGMDGAIHMSQKQCKANWIKENEPEVWDKTEFYLQVSGFFYYMLTGKIVDSIGSQIGQIPFDYKKQRWVKSKLAYQYQVFDIEPSKLSPLVSQGTDIGSLSSEAKKSLGFKHDIHVIVSGSDKGCETIGVGCLSPEKASISFGTAATIQTTTEKYCEPIRFMPSYPAAIKDKFNPEIQVFRGYWMIRWFKKEFANREEKEARRLGISPEEILNRELSTIEPGSNGLILQPYWKPDLKNPNAKGSIIGFSDVHTRAHIYRAIIEGINYNLYDGLLRIEKVTHQKVTKIYVSGGGSNSDAICQITADMFGVKVIRGQTYEASGLGASIVCYHTLGVFFSYEEAVKNMVHEQDVFEPNMKNHQKYREIYTKIYKRIYPKLKKLYKELTNILKK